MSGRVEDPALLSGQGRFIEDLDGPAGTMQAAIVRSTLPHARITRFDASAAERAPGVRAVIGPDQIAELAPFPLSAPAPMPYRPGAVERVRYVGEPVAVVVAESRQLAEDAAELVRVDYDPLPVVVAVRDAIDADAPLLHEEAESNVASDRSFVFGDVESAFAEAHTVVDGDFSFPRYSSTPIETYGLIADWRETADGGRLVAWCNFHGPFVLQPLIARTLGLPSSRVRLIVPEDIGGSFGIKSAIYPYVVLMALASRHARCPVRWIEDRVEHLLASSAGNDREMRFEAAVDEDGRITALRADLIDNVGAYLRPPEPSTLYRCFGNLTGAYGIGAVQIRSRAVVTNKAPTGLNRGFGGQQLYFGLERLVDKVAAATESDPAELRARNFIPADAFPYETPSGGSYDSGNYAAALERALERAGYQRLRERQRAAREDGRLLGVGLATIVDPSGTNLGYVSVATPADARGHAKSGSTEHVRVSVNPSGEVTVLLGTTPQGQGHRTVARQVVAERLGLPVEQVVALAEMDTATTPWTVSSGSYSSRFAPLTTSALADAADRIASVIRDAGAVMLGVPADTLELTDGKVRISGDPERSVLFRHAAGLVHWDPGSLPAGSDPRLYVEAAFAPIESRPPTSGDRINSSICYGFVAELALVEVDPDTLEISVLEVTSVHDAGTVLNQQLLDGQTLGSLAHGLGGATLEELRYAPDGQMVSASFMDYLCPTAAELDFELTLDHVSSPSPRTRLGAKGAGEGSSMSFPAALANAVTDALAPLGVEIDALPVHGAVLHELLEKTTTSDRRP